MPTLATIGRIQNPTPVGPPSIDPVPDSIHVRGGQLIVTTLTGFPFPDGAARVLRIDPAGGGVQTLADGFTSAIDAAPPSAIVPVVAAAAGAFNSQFTTSVQISNPYPFATSGRLVVHPAGAPASANDPSRAYSLAPFETKTIDDLIASGTGSVDVLAAVGTPVIVTTVREGNNRLQIPAVDPAEAITAGMRGTLITPADPSRQRFNIGIRTLGEGANITMRVHDSGGAVVATRTRVFGPHYFEQFSFANLLGMPAGASQAVTFEVAGGSAIVYGSAVDNTSGAMTFQLAENVEP